LNKFRNLAAGMVPSAGSSPKAVKCAKGRCFATYRRHSSLESCCRRIAAINTNSPHTTSVYPSISPFSGPFFPGHQSLNPRRNSSPATNTSRPTTAQTSPWPRTTSLSPTRARPLLTSRLPTPLPQRIHKSNPLRMARSPPISLLVCNQHMSETLHSLTDP
jgi:hypothetical protein